MYLHFARISVLKDRLSKVMDTIAAHKPTEVLHFHNKCYGTDTSFAPARGMEMPFSSIHLFEYLYNRLTELKDEIRPLNYRVAYLRPCSSRMSPDKHWFVSKIFDLIGVKHVQRQYQDEDALCCGGGAGNYYTDLLGASPESPARIRVRQERATGANILAVACPNCLTILEDAVKMEGLESERAVRDISKIFTAAGRNPV